MPIIRLYKLFFSVVGTLKPNLLRWRAFQRLFQRFGSIATVTTSIQPISEWRIRIRHKWAWVFANGKYAEVCGRIVFAPFQITNNRNTMSPTWMNRIFIVLATLKFIGLAWSVVRAYRMSDALTWAWLYGEQRTKYRKYDWWIPCRIAAGWGELRIFYSLADPMSAHMPINNRSKYAQ